MSARSSDGQNDAEPRDYLVCHGHSMCPLTSPEGVATLLVNHSLLSRPALGKRALQHQAA